jgi:hypothetical protein
VQFRQFLCFLLLGLCLTAAGLASATVMGVSGMSPCSMTVEADACRECNSASNLAYDSAMQANSSYDQVSILIQIRNESRFAGSGFPFGCFARFLAAENLPKVGGGAALENLTPNQIARIQAIADKRGVEINVVGSRAGGTADAASDWDYIINGGNARARNSALYELPKNPNATKAGDMRPGSEILRGFQVDPNRPYITFTPSRH